MFKELQIVNLYHDNAFLLYLRASIECGVFCSKFNTTEYPRKTLNSHRYLIEIKETVVDTGSYVLDRNLKNKRKKAKSHASRAGILCVNNHF